MLSSSVRNMISRSMPGAMPPWGGAPYWESLENVAEAFSLRLLVDAEQGKHSCLNVWPVDADGAGRPLSSVADDVVAVRVDFAGVCVEQPHVLGFRRSERVMRRSPALTLRVPLDQGEVEDPTEFHLPSVSQAAPIPNLVSEAVQHVVSRRILVGHKAKQVPVFGAGRRENRLQLWSAKLLGDSAPDGEPRARQRAGELGSLRVHRNRGQSSRAERFAELLKQSDLLARQGRSVWISYAADLSARLDHALENTELGGPQGLRDVE